MLVNYIKAYSSDYKGYKRNVSDGHGGYRIYYVYDYYYYFEFQKTNNTRYLVIEYSLGASSAQYLIFDNTVKGKYDEPSETPRKRAKLCNNNSFFGSWVYSYSCGLIFCNKV